VRFVPHVAHNEYEKARIFHQGLKASIRRVLGAFVLGDFCSDVERALGVEVQDDFTDELRGDSSQDQKGHTGGPTQKKDKNHTSGAGSGGGSGGGSTQFQVVAKPGLGLVCFRCGDTPRRFDCHWSGQCSRCGKDHKEVVCKKNPNSKLIWEPVVNSSSGQRGNAHMMTGAPSGIQYSTFPSQQLLFAPLVQ
jgi:hypothetical protein